MPGMREFRGQTFYAVPSMFLEELPREGIDEIDLSANVHRSIDTWRGSTAKASTGWYETGFVRPASKEAKAATSVVDTGAYEVGVLVHHDVYGTGCITDIAGQGVLRSSSPLQHGRTHVSRRQGETRDCAAG